MPKKFFATVVNCELFYWPKWEVTLCYKNTLLSFVYCGEHERGIKMLNVPFLLRLMASKS